jgi:tRNA-dihydrouridine synthase
MNNFWLRKKDRPNLILAPMAGYTDSAFRLLCREMGAGIIMTELVSADAIFHNKKIKNKIEKIKNADADLLDSDKTLSLMKFDDRERPIVIQLFGKYPEKFAYVAKWVVENLKPDGIDINMGCPARKVVGSDHGVALLKNHNLAVEIVQAVREQIDIPLSVKTRLGWENDDEILEFAPKLVVAGINAIIVHGRTYKDGFRNISRWKNIYKIKNKIEKIKNNVAVIGNGDIKSYNEAIERSESNGVKLDGIAIGRFSFGNPQIFQNHISHFPSLKTIILRHAKLSYKTKGDHGIIEFRKHLLAYTKGLSNARKLRREAVGVETIKDVKNIIGKMD